ncbi:unnamed protein product [Albugo candida]|uniref:Uncharacterized protein n=1 Tax=Albugo candida TaxID=65357 RepID=A0A024GHY8_9STRA|nr:unnamed protein product [Albugo candida]|eukprot:CCI46331.1 unnamed protein product [Albugo candida]
MNRSDRYVSVRITIPGIMRYATIRILLTNIKRHLTQTQSFDVGNWDLKNSFSISSSASCIFSISIASFTVLVFQIFVIMQKRSSIHVKTRLTFQMSAILTKMIKLMRSRYFDILMILRH